MLNKNKCRIVYVRAFNDFKHLVEVRPDACVLIDTLPEAQIAAVSDLSHRQRVSDGHIIPLPSVSGPRHVRCGVSADIAHITISTSLFGNIGDIEAVKGLERKNNALSFAKTQN